jgi:hypothetical protein
MRKLITAAALVMALVLLAPAQAQAQASGDVDVAITVNGLVILYYYDNVDVTIPSSVMTQLLGTDAADADATWASSVDATYVDATTLSVDNGAPDSATTPALPSGITLTIENAWSIRTLMGAGGSVTVSASANVANLSGGASGTIGVGGAACQGTCTVNGPQPLTTVHSGNVNLTGLDFTTVTAVDTFSAAAAYTVTATIS